MRMSNGGMTIRRGKLKMLKEHPAPVPLCLPQIPHDVTHVEKPASNCFSYCMVTSIRILNINCIVKRIIYTGLQNTTECITGLENISHFTYTCSCNRLGLPYTTCVLWKLYIPKLHRARWCLTSNRIIANESSCHRLSRVQTPFMLHENKRHKKKVGGGVWKKKRQHNHN
jgi:hypothetical protein